MGNNANKAALATRNLTDKEIEMIMVNTNLSKEDVLKWHNQFLTEFKDGFINKKEFIDIYKNTYSTGNAQKFALFAFKAFDEDQNGKITFPEFILSTSFLMKKNSPREDEQKRLELAFDIFDVNNDGKIDASELNKIFEALDEMDGEKNGKAKKKVKQIIAKYDLDHSRSLSKAGK